MQPLGQPATAGLVSTIVVHGGAGRASAEDRTGRQHGVGAAAEAGWRVLAAGGSALDAVAVAVAALEDDPHFNAGRGSVLTVDGAVELDASVMEGTGLAAGAVGAVSGVPNPIRLAQALLDEGRDVLVVGEAARTRAEALGVPVCAPDALVTTAARERWQAGQPATGETVGAVARDARGRTAAATSTGGIAGKRRGRVGDSAVIGAGTYADDRLGAGSATGPGEAIIRFGVVRAALEWLGRGHDPAWVAAHTLAELQRRLGVTAGLILVDPAGRVGTSRTTDAMAAAWRTLASGRTIVID